MKSEPKLPRRIASHVTDTLAVRNIISSLPPNWVIRGLEERDYGIDLSIELFNGELPTGCTSLIQVKGTDSAFSDQGVTLSGFPTKTLEYALLFPQAVFVFYASISNKTTYFIWLQKYIDIRLNKDTQGWAEQGTNTLYFPDENVLEDSAGIAKIEFIMRNLAAHWDGLGFLADYETLKHLWKSYASGETGVIETCIELVDEIRKHKAFFTVYEPERLGININGLKNCLEHFLYCPIKDSYRLEDDEARAMADVDLHLQALEATKMTFLTQRETDQFEEAVSSSSPY